MANKGCLLNGNTVTHCPFRELSTCGRHRSAPLQQSQLHSSKASACGFVSPDTQRGALKTPAPVTHPWTMLGLTPQALETTVSAPAQRTSLFIRQILLECHGHPPRSSYFPEMQTTWSGEASRKGDCAGELVELSHAAEIWNPSQGCPKDFGCLQPHSRKCLPVNIQLSFSLFLLSEGKPSPDPQPGWSPF